MSRWFRFYADAIRNPKVAKLNDAQFRLWVELLAVASENGGVIPPLEDLKHVLKRRLDHLSRGVKDLLNAGLIDPLEDGYEPHNWKKFQYKSDTSTDRVKKHRAERNVSPAVTETPPEAETEQSKPIDKSIGSRTRRGTRLPVGFEMPDEWLHWAMTERHWPAADARDEAASFTDFWHAKAGKDAVKLDWEATWRNWVRKARRVAVVVQQPRVPL